MRTSSAIFMSIFLLFTHAVSQASTGTADSDECKKYSATKANLSHIYDEYSSLPKKRENAEKLFLFYRRLEKAAKKAQAIYPTDYNRNSAQYVVISRCLWDDRFIKLGLEIGHYSDRLEYSLLLMAEAHQLNPHTQYRRYTLFTDVLGNNIAGNSEDLPDIEKARSYLKEFPEGPYVTEVFEILAGFYHDLYAELRAIEKEPKIENRDLTYSCFDEYIAKHPKEAKLERTRKLGILYFEKVIAAISSKDHKRPMYLNELDALKKGNTDNVVNVCGD